MRAKGEGQVREAVDDGACPGSGEVFSFAGLVGVADALDSSEAGAFYVGNRVSDKCTFVGLAVEGAYCLSDQVRTGLEEGGVMVGPRNDQANPVI